MLLPNAFGDKSVTPSQALSPGVHFPGPEFCPQSAVSRARAGGGLHSSLSRGAEGYKALTALAGGSDAERQRQLRSSASRLRGSGTGCFSHPLPLKVTRNQPVIQLKSLPATLVYVFSEKDKTKMTCACWAHNQPCMVLGDKWRVKTKQKKKRWKI